MGSDNCWESNAMGCSGWKSVPTYVEPAMVPVCPLSTAANSACYASYCPTETVREHIEWLRKQIPHPEAKQ